MHLEVRHNKHLSTWQLVNTFFITLKLRPPIKVSTNLRILIISFISPPAFQLRRWGLHLEILA